MPHPPPRCHAELEFRLTGEFIALNDLLEGHGRLRRAAAPARRSSRRARSQVDGAVELRKTCKIRAGQTVRWATSRSACFATLPRA